MLRNTSCSIAILLLSALALPAAAAADDDEIGGKLNQQETIRQSHTFTGSGAKSLSIDNVWGSIEVVGVDSNQAQIVIHKTIRAESQAAMEKAKKEVELEVTRDEDTLKLYVDGPFRCQNDCGNCNGGWHEGRGYVVKFDFEVQVPRQVALSLKTVNDGRIKVQGVAGNFSLHNVNGGIDVLDTSGSGEVKTVNGGVKVTFSSNPKSASSFATINGPIELYFARDLSADFRFKNFNGGIYSDFALTALPAQEAAPERRNGRFVFRSDRFTGGRVGSGGPEIKIENLNGDIRVLERHAT
jgi:hypothetical protein